MIKAFKIENFKSINSLEVEFGRVNVFVGENGSGKSNVLEALALSTASALDKLDREFLSSRGIRDVEPSLMRACFYKKNVNKPITLTSTIQKEDYTIEIKNDLFNDNKPYSKWKKEIEISYYTNEGEKIPLSELAEDDYLEKSIKNLHSRLNKISSTLDEKEKEKEEYQFIYKELEEITNRINEFHKKRIDYRKELSSSIKVLAEDFIIFSPENTALRNFYKEGQIEPLGINGEGLLKLLKVTRENNIEEFEKIKNYLNIFCWYKDINIQANSNEEEPSVLLTDRFLSDIQFDQRSANEGFLFVLFYISLILSKETPRYIAIDNIDASLNPKLCTRLMRDIVALAKSNDKQLFLTTHNPAILDGLDLSDHEQKLFVVSRTREGHTKLKALPADIKPIQKDGTPMKLSDALMRGYLGGLPKGF